jgi:hypothetical protein
MNKLSIILPAAAICLGSMFLYLGFESGTGGYVTLSIDGAFLLLLGLVSIFSPKADTAEVDFLESLSKQVPGAAEYIEPLLEGKVCLVFTKEANIIVVDSRWSYHRNGSISGLRTLEPLSVKMRRNVDKELRSNHAKHGQFKLTEKYANLLADSGALSQAKFHVEGSTVTLTLVRPLTGVPLLPKAHDQRESQVLTISSRLLSNMCCLLSADLKKDTVLSGINREPEELTIKLEVL